MFSSLAYEGLESFLNPEENSSLLRAKTEHVGGSDVTIRSANSASNGYTTAQSSPLIDASSRVRMRGPSPLPNRKLALVPSTYVTSTEPTYEGVSALSSFGRPLSRMSTNTVMSSVMSNTPERKLSTFQSNDEAPGVVFNCRESQSSVGSLGARNNMRLSNRVNSNDNILSAANNAATATSRVNPSTGGVPDFDSATLGRRPLTLANNNNFQRSSLASQNRVSGPSSGNNGNSPSALINSLRQQSMEHPDDMFLKFSQNGLGTMFVPPAPGGSAGDDRVQFIKGNSPIGGAPGSGLPLDDYGMSAAANGGAIIWPQTVNRGPTSMHDYQPLTPFQESGNHMQPMGTMGGPGVNNGKSMYDDDQETSFCINWKCIITLFCIFLLLFIGLLFLIAIKFYYADTQSLAPLGANDNRVMPLDEFIDKSLEISVPPKSSRMLSIYAMGPSLLTLHIKTSSSRLIIYGLEGAEPCSTNFTFVHSLSSTTPQFDSNSKVIYTSSSSSEDMKTVYQYLSNGKWYIRVFNDVNSYEVLDILTKLVNRRAECPQDCNYPKGECNAMGYCVCTNQYRGRFCEKPALSCGQHGRLVRVGTLSHGFSQACKCDPGWTGSLCDQSESGCYPPDCSGNGQCVFGTCHCNPGFLGDACNRTMCDSRCSDHGVCVDGNCICSLGYYGVNCESNRNPDCKSTCKNGNCVYGTCQCEKGFRGSSCNQQVCKDDCSGNGQCVTNENSQWSCRCNSGFVGANCEIKTEPSCQDICETNPACCKADGSCLPSDNRPNSCQLGTTYLDRETEAIFNHRTSFLETVSFLYNEQTDQRTLPFDLKDRKFIFVVRGQITVEDSRPYLGATVSVKDHESLGFANTQYNGWFDLLVATDSIAVSVHVNYTGVQSGLPESKGINLRSTNEKIVTLLNTIEADPESANPPGESIMCDKEKLPQYMKSMPHFTKFASMQSKYNYGSVISQNLVTQSYTPEDSFPTMVFNSNIQGARTIVVFLGDFSEQPQVSLVHVTVAVAGLVFSETLDNSMSPLYYELNWNRTDIYGNKVFGLVEVQAKIEYSVSGCSKRFWINTLKTQIEGFSCHDSVTYEHHYCMTRGSSLYNGKGHSFHLSLYPPVMRNMQCLNPPKVIESLSNGDLLIGDKTQIFLVRETKIGNRCELDYAVYSFGSGGLSDDVEYFIAADPSNADYFYLSRSDSAVITKVYLKSRTFEVVLGKENTFCHDHINSCNNTLKSPKGMTVLQNGTLVFVDGLSLRSWNPASGFITTLWTPSLRTAVTHQTCSDIPSELVFLPQLKKVHHSTLDDTYLLFDYSRSVVKFNLRTNRMSFLAARAKMACKNMNQQSVARVYYPCSMTVSGEGDLFVADSDPLNKRTTVFKVSGNNLWSEFWHSDLMQIMSEMTITNNKTLLMINDEKKQVDILGQYKILSEKTEQFQITDLENYRNVFFDANWLHVKSSSVATMDFTEELFLYYPDSTSLKNFYQSAAAERLFMAKKDEYWSVQRGGLTRDYSQWQQSVWDDIQFDSRGLIADVSSVSVSREHVFLEKQLVEMTVYKMSQNQLQSVCLSKQFQSGHTLSCTDGSSFGMFSSYSLYPTGEQRLVFPDQTGYSFRSALPGLSMDFKIESISTGKAYSINYVPKSRTELYGLELSANDGEVIMKKLFNSDRSLVVAFASAKKQLVSFNLDPENMLPSLLFLQNGASGLSHKFDYNSARQLTSIVDGTEKMSLFDAKYTSDLSVINDVQYSTDTKSNQLEVSLMTYEDGQHKSTNLYNIHYDENYRFQLSTGSDGQQHSVFSFREAVGYPSSSIYKLFSDRISFKTTFNASTMSLETFDGQKRKATLKLDSSYRLTGIQFDDTKTSISYSAMCPHQPREFETEVSSVSVMSYSSDSRSSNLTVNRATGSKWLSASFDQVAKELSITLRQQWGASVDLFSSYSPLKLKSSTHASKSDQMALTFTDGSGVDVVQESNRLEQGYNDQFGPNRFHKTSFLYNDREVLQTKVSENKDKTYSFSIRINSDDQKSQTHSYSVAIGSSVHCGKLIRDPLLEQSFFYENCRLTRVISQGKTKYLIAKTYSSDGRLQKISRSQDNVQDITLSFNSHGFISRLGKREFSYNPLGQLIRAENDDYLVEYEYNIAGRLVARHLTSTDDARSVDHAFFYHDIRNADKISHILLADRDESPKVYELYYDNREQVVMVKEMDSTYLVLNDPLGTAVKLMQIDKELWNVREEDFPAGVKLSLKGSWYDEEMGLVYLNHRFFDLETYTYLDLDLTFLQNAVFSPFETPFTTYINDAESFWPKSDLSEIGAFKTYMPELWFNETMQSLLTEMSLFRPAHGSLQLTPSVSSFAAMLQNLISTPLKANLPSVNALPFFQLPAFSTQSAMLTDRHSKFVLPPFSRVLNPRMRL